MTLLWMLACSGSSTTGPAASVEAEDIGLAECAVCGMVVGEQPSPRGQIVYRDGTHEHVCSIEELRAVAQQRSARGKPVGVYVEVLPSSFDPVSNDVAQLPWSPVEDAWFVFGVDRTGVMGTPVLSFSEASVARRHADTVGSVPLGWAPLNETPFHAVPDGAHVDSQP